MENLFQPDESTEASAKDVFEENYKELIKWVDAKTTKYGTLTVLRERRCGRCGTALKVYSPCKVPVICTLSICSCNYKNLKENRMLSFSNSSTNERMWV
jgi:hypothetical protein